MKKVILIVLSILTCFCIAIGLTACSKNGQSTPPTIEIGSDGYWYINGTKTEYKANGEQGEQGEQGKQGEKGSDGINGSNGVDGKDGKDGKDGVDGKSPVITIGENGNWFIDGVDTNVKAQGEKGDKGDAGENGSDGKDGVNGSDGKDGKDGVDGKSPVITIGENGNWFIDGVDTNVKVQGEKGDKGDAGENGSDGKDGLNGSDGKDGNGVKTIVINDKGELIITLDDGTVINAGPVVAPVRKLDENNNIKFNTLTVGGNAVTGSVAYGSDIFDFNSEITINGYAGFKVYKDVTGKEEIETKVQSLNLGENVFYIKEYCGETSRFYTVTVTRSDPQVTFDSIINQAG